MKVNCLICKICKYEYEVSPKYVCEMCFGPLEVKYNWEYIRKNISIEKISKGPKSIWRYIDLLPLESDYEIDLQSGFTPLVRAKNLGEYLGLDNLWIKNDSLNPTFSFKDRVVSIASNKAKEFGLTTLACASTGNLAGSVAAHGAKGGLETVVFIPKNLEKEKIISAGVYNPRIVTIDGTYDDVNRICTILAEEKEGWAFANINMRPFYSEGSKTLGYEIVEQLGWEAPDNIICPGGSGSLFTKVWKGISEFEKLGFIENINTKMHIAQAQGCSPIINAIDNNNDFIEPVIPETIAKSIAIGNPADGLNSVNLVNKTNGTGTSVSEKEIIQGIRLLAETEGIFTETAGGVVIASLIKLSRQNKLPSDEKTVCLITGNGLKTPDVVSNIKTFDIDSKSSNLDEILSKV